MIQDPILINDWHVIAPSKNLAEGQLLKARLLGEDLVLWRREGQVLAWQDLCLHRGARLSDGRVEEARLMCPYHGWTYDGEGRCVHIPAHPEQTPPAKAVVRTYQAQEKYDLIWVCLGEASQEIAPFPEWADDSYRKILCGPYEFRAAGPRAIENFLDVAHFPFVHEGLLGDKQHPEIEDYDAEIGPDGVVAKDIKIWQPDPDGTGVGAAVTYTYCAFRPLIAYFTKSSDGPSFAIFFAVTPVDELHSIGWMWETMNYAYEVPEEDLRAFQDKVVAQDVPIVEGQRPELLPLDLQAELHLRSDRTAIAYRQWLRELGLRYGTA